MPDGVFKPVLHSYFASKEGRKQLRFNIWFEKTTVPLYRLKGRTIQLCE